mmetsp:Transcript_28414/g.48020  ORF Transcript_28414/g.48020 Transcript_28414/m.48020 type:complete len:92 (+) Transcript_28414:2-277(+)
MQDVLQSLLNDDFQTAYHKILQRVGESGYAVCDIVTELSARVLLIDLPDPVVAHLLDKLSTVEFRLSHGVCERVQVGAVVGAFTVARSMMQ